MKYEYGKDIGFYVGTIEFDVNVPKETENVIMIKGEHKFPDLNCWFLGIK